MVWRTVLKIRNFFSLISPWKRHWPYIWTVTQECFVFKFAWNWSWNSLRRLFSNVVSVFSLICYHLAFEKGVAHPFVQTRNPITQRWFVSIFFVVCIMRSVSDCWPRKRKVGCSNHSRECHGSSEMTIINRCPVSNRCGTLKNPHCSTAMNAEHRSKFAALHR